MNKTSQEVRDAVALDLKQRKITHQKAGEAIGKSKAVVSNALSGKKYFSKDLADRFAQAFSYNAEYLLFGKGELKVASKICMLPENQSKAPTEFDRLVMASLIDIAGHLIHLSDNRDIIMAWSYLSCGKFEEFCKYLFKAQENSKYTGKQSMYAAELVAENITKVMHYAPIIVDMPQDTEKQ